MLGQFGLERGLCSICGAIWGPGRGRIQNTEADLRSEEVPKEAGPSPGRGKRWASQERENCTSRGGGKPEILARGSDSPAQQMSEQKIPLLALFIGEDTEAWREQSCHRHRTVVEPGRALPCHCGPPLPAPPSPSPARQMQAWAVARPLVACLLGAVRSPPPGSPPPGPRGVTCLQCLSGIGGP